MHQFNYFGNNTGQANAFEEDVEQLEREIENVMMRKVGTAAGGQRDRLDQNIVNMQTQHDAHRTQTAGNKDGRRRRHIPKHPSMTV